MEQDRWVNEPKKKNNHSKSLLAFGVIIVILAVLFFILHGESKVKVLTLNKTVEALGVDETDSLIVTIIPDDVHPVLVWESSDENIAIVKDGIVTTRNIGDAIIRVSVKDQEGVFAICKYTVIESDVDMETLDIIGDPLLLRPGGHQLLSVNFTPENQNEMILWSSTNESVARVSPRGKVEALRPGFTTIIARSERTGVADTAAVSVEGVGVKIDNAVVQDPKPQQNSKEAAKSIPTVTPHAVSAKATKTTSVTVAPKSTTTTAPKSVSAKTAKTTSVTAAPRSTSTTAVKSTSAKSTKSTPATTSKTVKSSGTQNFGYATYKGSWPNDVKGRMDFKISHVIDSRDPKGRVAEAGDYVIGEWSDGHLVQGVWYGSDNRAKGSILIGK